MAHKSPPKKTWPASHVEMRPIDSLTPYARNARIHSDEQIDQIAASMKEWGWTNPVLADEDGGIIAGHGRILAAQKLGYAECPVMVAEGWTDAQKRAYVIADNKLALNAGWDNEMLSAEFDELQGLGFDLGLTGFGEAELQGLGIGVEGGEWPDIPDGEKGEYQQMTFTLHNSQIEQVQAALSSAKAMGDFDSPNENSNGNAIARICETFLSDHGQS